MVIAFVSVRRVSTRTFTPGPFRKYPIPVNRYDIAQGVLLEVKELDRNYDAQTAHGRSEGLWSVTD